MLLNKQCKKIYIAIQNKYKWWYMFYKHEDKISIIGVAKVVFTLAENWNLPFLIKLLGLI